MESDWWRQWQVMTGLAPDPVPGAGLGGGTPGFGGGASGFAPFLVGAERFASAARSFYQAAGNAATSAAAAQSFGNFLRDQFADIFKPPSPAAFGIGRDASAASMPDAPALGLTREHQERAQRASQAWHRLEDAQRRLQRLWADTLREAAQSFASRISAPPAGPFSTEALNRLYDAWIDCAEEAYARTAHGEAFCDALADYVNAGGQWRLETSAMLEQWAKALDLPTRQEIDTLTQRIRSLEDQVRPKPKTRATKAAASKARRARPRGAG
jgi:hypothetical protein